MPFQNFRTPNAGPRSRRAPRLSRRARSWFDGTLVELDPEQSTVVLRVHNGSTPIPPRGTEITIEASSARVEATDGDGDGRAGLTDLFPGDRVLVHLKPPRRRRLVATRIVQESAGAPSGGLRPLLEPSS